MQTNQEGGKEMKEPEFETFGSEPGELDARPDAGHREAERG